MAGINQSVKRAWSFLTRSSQAIAGDPLRGFYDQINNLVTDVETLRAMIANRQDGVANVEFVATAAAALAVDANAQDIQTGRDVVCRTGDEYFTAVADAAADVSVLLGTGNTIAASKSGALWVFGRSGNTDLVLAVPSAAEAEETDLAALAQEVPAPPVVGDVPIGVVMATVDATLWEWGSDSTGVLGTDSTVETYYDLINRPKITSAMASFALDAAAATFTYGAATALLGDGTTLTITGKANVAFVTGELTVIADKKFGAFVLFALADDDELALQIGAAYDTLHEAQTAVDDLRPNPLLVELGRIYIENDSGADFTPATTNLDATGITVTFETAAVVPTVLAKTDLVAQTLVTPESQD